MNEEENKDSHNRVGDFIQDQNSRLISKLGRRVIMWGGRALASGGMSLLAGGITAVLLVLIFTTVIMFFTGIQGQASENSSTVAPNIHFYCQYDPRWIDSACNIVSTGCHPTALAMILSSFGRIDLTPRAVAFQNGNMGCFIKTGTTHQQIKDSIEWTRSLGFTVTKVNVAAGRDFNTSLAKQYLDKGYLLLGIANVKFRTTNVPDNGGHSFVITGVDPTSQNLTVLDPTYCTSDDSFSTRTLNINDVFCEKDCGWMYVYAIKK